MGDEERSKEAEQEEEEKEMKTVLPFPPIYSLPEEIKKMERSETVCSYCGVSYLIFHEFHQLHTRLAQLEEELQGLRATAQREKAQREALELGRLEWEKALRLEVQRQTEEKEKSTREALEGRHSDAERALRGEFELKWETERQKMKDEHQEISDEKERRVRRELGELQAETLREQREELERRTEERERVLSDALQKANKHAGELRKYLQQLEERLAKAAHAEEEAGRALEKEMRQGEILRGACVRQQQALRATLSVLRSSGSELTDVRGFLSQLTGVWQAFRSQILQHSAQVFSVLGEELKHSSAALQKMREEKERLTQQLMEQRRRHEEKLSQQKDSDNQHRGKLLRLEEELEEKHEELLSSHRRCDIMQEQLTSYRAAEEEVARLREALEKVQQEARELRREREILAESHGRVLTKMEEDCRQQMSSELAAALEEQRAQNALHLREQMEEVRREVELELTIDREKNQVLLLQYQWGSTQLQEKLEEREQVLRGLQDELQEERGSWVEERRRREEEMRQELQRSQQQEAPQLSQAKAGLQLVTERNAELQEEVALLQETVRRECEEREELTAALSRAQGELLGLRSPASHHGSSRSPPNPIKRHHPPGNKHFHLQSQTRVTLTRSLNSPNTLRPAPLLTDKDRGQGTDGGGAGRGFESWNGDEKRREGTLPRLRASSTVGQVKRKVSLATERKERL